MYMGVNIFWEGKGNRPFLYCWYIGGQYPLLYFAFQLLIFFGAVLNALRYSAVSNSLYHSYDNILRIDTSYNIIRL